MKRLYLVHLTRLGRLLFLNFLSYDLQSVENIGETKGSDFSCSSILLFKDLLSPQAFEITSKGFGDSRGGYRDYTKLEGKCEQATIVYS